MFVSRDAELQHAAATAKYSITKINRDASRNLLKHDIRISNNVGISSQNLQSVDTHRYTNIILITSPKVTWRCHTPPRVIIEYTKTPFAITRTHVDQLAVR